MESGCAYFVHMYYGCSYFLFGKQRLRFNNLLYKKITEIKSWENGILTVRGEVIYGGIETHQLCIEDSLLELGYDARKIISMYPQVQLLSEDEAYTYIEERHFYLYKSEHRKYCIHNARGTAVFYENGMLIMSTLPMILEKEAELFMKNEIRSLKNRNEREHQTPYVDRLPDMASDNYCFFRDGEIFYVTYKDNPDEWCILNKYGHRIHSEFPHSETYDMEWVCEQCLKLVGVEIPKQVDEQTYQITELGTWADSVKYGIAFNIEENLIRATPLGWPGEYALFNNDGEITENCLNEDRVERVKTAFTEESEFLCGVIVHENKRRLNDVR